MVGAKGFEPSTSWSRTRRASQAALRPDNEALRGKAYTRRDPRITQDRRADQQTYPAPRGEVSRPESRQIPVPGRQTRRRGCPLRRGLQLPPKLRFLEFVAQLELHDTRIGQKPGVIAKVAGVGDRQTKALNVESREVEGVEAV